MPSSQTLLDRKAPLLWVFYGGSRGKSTNLVHVLVNKALLQGETCSPEHGRALLSAQQLPVPLSAPWAPSFTPLIFHQQQVGPFTLVMARAHPHRCLPILHTDRQQLLTRHITCCRPDQARFKAQARSRTLLQSFFFPHMKASQSQLIDTARAMDKPSGHGEQHSPSQHLIPTRRL